MTNPTPLSPAAQAVIQAIDEVRWDWGNMQEADANIIAAAALRSVANLLSAEVDAPKVDGTKYNGLWHSYDLLNAIADELEGAND